MLEPYKKYIFIALIAILLLGGVTVANYMKVKKKIMELYGNYIEEASKLLGIPQERILSHIVVESSGNQMAVGSAGERGLMQLKEVALADANKMLVNKIRFDELFDPRKNIIAGTAYLAWIKKFFYPNDLDQCSRAYNQGPGKSNSVLAYAYQTKINAVEFT